MDIKETLLQNTYDAKITNATGQGELEIRLSARAGLHHLRQRVREGAVRGELWYTFVPSDEVGTRKVHAVTPDMEDIFNQVVTSTGREKFLIGVVERQPERGVDAYGVI